MFGYATDETDECMPLTVVLAHKLNQKIAELRRSGELWWARPDSKTQVWHCTVYTHFSNFIKKNKYQTKLYNDVDLVFATLDSHDVNTLTEYNILNDIHF